MNIKDFHFLKGISLFLFICLSFTAVNSQEKSKKELRKELKAKQKQEKIDATKALVDSKAFVFKANMVLPSGMRSVNVNAEGYEVSFQPDIIESYLPYFGRATSAIAYSNSDGGIKFKEKPEKFNIESAKKGYELTAVVKDDFDTYDLFLSIGLEGNASLKVNSSKRSFISYNGNIYPLPEIEEKK